MTSRAQLESVRQSRSEMLGDRGKYSGGSVQVLIREGVPELCHIRCFEGVESLQLAEPSGRCQYG